MSYTPTNWTNGDVITTEKLNKIENGIVTASSSGGVLVVNMVYDDETDTEYTDKTWKEIYDAPIAVIVQESGMIKSIVLVERVAHIGSDYGVVCYGHSLVQGEIIIE